jgi:hypothetical protein
MMSKRRSQWNKRPGHYDQIAENLSFLLNTVDKVKYFRNKSWKKVEDKESEEWFF